jgi:hypothetical protein
MSHGFIICCRPAYPPPLQYESRLRNSRQNCKYVEALPLRCFLWMCRVVVLLSVMLSHSHATFVTAAACAKHNPCWAVNPQQERCYRCCKGPLCHQGHTSIPNHRMTATNHRIPDSSDFIVLICNKLSVCPFTGHATTFASITSHNHPPKLERVRLHKRHAKRCKSYGNREQR